MIENLHIENIAVVKSIDIDLTRGFMQNPLQSAMCIQARAAYKSAVHLSSSDCLFLISFFATVRLNVIIAATVTAKTASSAFVLLSRSG